MKHTQKLIVGIGASLTLALAAVAVSAQPGQMGEGKGHGMQGGQHKGMQGEMHGGMHGGKQGGMQHDGQGSQAAQQLMTPEERTAMREKMQSAKTPEERQQIAAANRTEMQKRATEKGMTLPENRGPRGGNAEHKH